MLSLPQSMGVMWSLYFLFILRHYTRVYTYLQIKKFHVHLTKIRGTDYQVSVVLAYELTMSW